MIVGNIIVPKDGTDPLASGSWRYQVAIVIQIDPFIITSVDGDMLWMRRFGEDFRIIGKANAKTLMECRKRLET